MTSHENRRAQDQRPALQMPQFATPAVVEYFQPPARGDHDGLEFAATVMTTDLSNELHLEGVIGRYGLAPPLKSS